LVVRYWLFVVGYWLFVSICYWLFVIGYWLFVIGYSSFVIRGLPLRTPNPLPSTLYPNTSASKLDSPDG